MTDRSTATFDESMATFALAITIVLAKNDSVLDNGGEFTTEMLASKINNLNINSYADIHINYIYLHHAFGLYANGKFLNALNWKVVNRERGEELLIPAIGEFKEMRPF
jgi:hypothetical protein